MKKRIFSFLVSIILIFSIICCASVPGSAVFVVDDVLLYSIGISVAASIALSCGIAVASGQDNAFSTGANALGQMVYESLQEQYSQAQLLSMIVISNGKVYFKSPEALYTRIKNYLQNYDFSELKFNQSLTSANTSFPWLSGNFGQAKDSYALAIQPSPLSISYGGTTINYVPGVGINWHLSNADIYWKGYTTTFGSPTFTNFLDGYVGGLSIPQGDSGTVYLSYVTHNGTPTASPSDSDSFSRGNVYGGGYFPLFSNNSGTSIFYTVINGQVHNVYYSNNDTVCIDNGNTRLTGSVSFNSYVRKCILAGTLLVSRNNPYLPVNSDSNFTSVTKPVDISKSAPSIPDSQIGRDSSVLVPLPGNLVDPSNPDIPLTQSSVKNRIKRGQSVEYIPDIEKLNGILPRDYPVLVTNTVTDTQVIDTPLSTTFIGDNSETFLVIPNNPGVVAVPEANDEPIVNYPYPDVINPGNETITVVNNPDVFPTRVPAETATAAPGETVGEITRVSEIVDEAVSDIVQPVTPEDIENGANKMKLSSQLMRKFPFCIPFDFYNAVNQFAAPAEVPSFDIPFTFERLNFNYNFHIDLSQFETAAKISRWFFSVSWVVVLIFLTRKVIWK